MPIPDNIQREHIFQAMLRIHKEEVPSRKRSKRMGCKLSG
jgi:hypothetical protein